MYKIDKSVRLKLSVQDWQKGWDWPQRCKLTVCKFSKNKFEKGARLTQKMSDLKQNVKYWQKGKIERCRIDTMCKIDTKGVRLTQSHIHKVI